MKLKFWLSFALAVAFAIYFAARIAMTLMAGGMPIRKINVYAAPGNASADLPGALEYGAKTNSLIDIKNRILSLPDTEYAAVRRMGNGDLKIKIQYRIALAVWLDGTNFYPLAPDGSVISKPIGERPQNMIVFRGKISGDISDIVGALRAFPGVMNNTDYVEQVESRRWNIVTPHRSVIMLPEKDFRRALESLAGLEKGQKIMSREFAVLDMRDPAKILVK
jgi:cell division protein FtsQ